MVATLVWRSKEYTSLENCTASITHAGADISSVIIGVTDDKIFKVEYRLKINSQWETEYIEIKSIIEGVEQSFSFHGNGKGSWQRNGESLPRFNGCIDVDLPLTPFTNTLPINRLKLQHHQQQQIKVLYLDLLNNETKPVTQMYTRLSDTSYKYENVPNDFEAVIRVDDLGFVVDYPTLFGRIARKDGSM
jgi:uncharacterized protein